MHMHARTYAHTSSPTSLQFGTHYPLASGGLWRAEVTGGRHLFFLAQYEKHRDLVLPLTGLVTPHVIWEPPKLN